RNDVRAVVIYFNHIATEYVVVICVQGIATQYGLWLYTQCISQRKIYRRHMLVGHRDMLVDTH
ncbi:hypothetical protein Q6247_25470, partial [Klebsiella pneumoniae]